MSFTNNNAMPAAANNDIKLNVDQSTVDLLNAAIASHSQMPLQPFQDDKENTSIKPTDTSASTQGTSKRSIDSTDESDAIPSAVAPKRAGRKPLEKTTTSDPLDPKQKRKAQNRAAQRAFRERKEKHVSELQDRIKELEELTSKTDTDLIQENEQLKERLKQLEEENYALKDAKFTFEFPVSDQQQVHDTTTSSSKTNDLHDETISSSSSSSTEQSPLSLTHEDDYSDSPTTKTPTNLQSSSFLPFGAFGGTSHDFDVLTNNGSAGSEKGINTLLPSTYDYKELFHGKDDLFTGYRTPINNTTLTTDEFNTDDFLLDSNNNNTGLPDLFGGSGDLFGFTQQQQDQHAPFLLDQFYMPGENQPHVRKETVATSLQRAKNNGVRAYEVQEQLKNCSDFNLDALCSELKSKASCCESKYVLSEHDVDAYLACFDQK